MMTVNHYSIEMAFDTTSDDFDDLMKVVAEQVMQRNNAVIVGSEVPA